MSVLTKDIRKRGDQTAVFNSNLEQWQVQTWTGSQWYGFILVPEHKVSAEKIRQLAELHNYE
jgi:hypothetical protein